MFCPKDRFGDRVMQSNLTSAITSLVRRLPGHLVLQRIFRWSIQSNLHNKSDMSNQDNTSSLKYDIPYDKKVFVQKNPVNDILTISFRYEKGDKIRQFNLYRSATEPLRDSIERIKLNLIKFHKVKKKEPPSKEDESDGYTAKLIIDGSSADPDVLLNKEAWIEGAILELDNELYYVTTNSPQVENIRIPNLIMEGFVAVPILSLVNCSLDKCKFAWYRKISRKERDQIISESGSNEDLIETDEYSSYWYKLCDEMFYCPTIDDLAHDLKVVCWPSDGIKSGPKSAAISTSAVEVGPKQCSLEQRFAQTSNKLTEPDKFRVVSYNILADLYADQEYSREHLFAHCPAYALSFDYRRQLLLKELHRYNADIVCLQEVDQKEFKRSFESFFDIVTKLKGIFGKKGGQVAEGVATFYSTDKFELVDSHKTLLAELIESRENIISALSDETQDSTQKESGDINKVPSLQEEDMHFILKDRDSAESKRCLSKFETIRSAILANPKLKRRFLARHTVIQTTLLRLKDTKDKFVIVANTHLYFAPDADHVRLLQGSVCIKYLEYVKDLYTRKLVDQNPQINPSLGIILCGDMNSTPDCGLFKLATEGKISDKLPDWTSNQEEAVVGLNLETNLRFASSYLNLKYTNFTPLFNGCLDYIYTETESFDCENTVSLPKHEDVIATGGIPSDVFPSDHLALIANLRYKMLL